MNPSPIKRDTPSALCEVGISHMLAGRYVDARLYAQQALAIDPAHADALHLIGLLCIRSGQYDHAVEWIGRAIRQNPKPDYLSNLGTALKQGGRLNEALQVFDKAIQLKPDDTQAWIRLANMLGALGRKAEALSAYQHVLQLNPRQWDVAYQCWRLLREAARFEEALSFYDRCDQCLGEVLQADALAPSDIVSRNNVGIALLNLNRPQEALQWSDKALALRPEFSGRPFQQGSSP